MKNNEINKIANQRIIAKITSDINKCMKDAFSKSTHENVKEIKISVSVPVEIANSCGLKSGNPIPITLSDFYEIFYAGKEYENKTSKKTSKRG